MYFFYFSQGHTIRTTTVPEITCIYRVCLAMAAVFVSNLYEGIGISSHRCESLAHQMLLYRSVNYVSASKRCECENIQCLIIASKRSVSDK